MAFHVPAVSMAMEQKMCVLAKLAYFEILLFFGPLLLLLLLLLLFCVVLWSGTHEKAVLEAGILEKLISVVIEMSDKDEENVSV